MRISKLIMRLRSIDLEHDTEDDTIQTINAYLDENEEEYQRFYGRTRRIVGENADVPESVDISDEIPAGQAGQIPEKKERKKRTPKAAVEAVAPAPIPVGDTPPAPVAPAPVVVAPPAPVAPPVTVAAPPPPAPVAPPPAPKPPVGQLADKVIADLKARAEGQPDGGAALVAWLAGAGLCVPGCTFDEAILCVAMLDDAKLGPAAGQLGVVA